jgi:hypothetical protein
MSKPTLTFFCELESQPLADFFHNGQVIKELQKLGANLSLGILDLSTQRAEVVKKLNRAGIPVTAWILLPRELGYWTSLDTIDETEQRYQEFKAWVMEHKLKFVAVGLDIEPRLDTMSGFSRQPANQIMKVIQRFFTNRCFRLAKLQAQQLIQTIREDGYPVETYQFPTVVDERAARSNVLARTLGIPDLDADREVLMLYSSFFPVYADSILWSYARQCQAVGVGSSGGGVEIEGVPPLKTLRWIDLKRDLLLSSQAAGHLYIFSLEGCVENKFMNRLLDLDWETQVIPPERTALGITLLRKLGQCLSWSLSHPFEVILGTVFLNKILKWIRSSSS